MRTVDASTMSEFRVGAVFGGVDRSTRVVHVGMCAEQGAEAEGLGPRSVVRLRRRCAELEMEPWMWTPRGVGLSPAWWVKEALRHRRGDRLSAATRPTTLVVVPGPGGGPVDVLQGRRPAGFFSYDMIAAKRRKRSGASRRRLAGDCPRRRWRPPSARPGPAATSAKPAKLRLVIRRSRACWWGSRCLRDCRQWVGDFDDVEDLFIQRPQSMLRASAAAPPDRFHRHRRSWPQTLLRARAQWPAAVSRRHRRRGDLPHRKVAVYLGFGLGSAAGRSCCWWSGAVFCAADPAGRCLGGRTSSRVEKNVARSRRVPSIG